MTHSTDVDGFDADVAVIGAGPVGTLLAILLGQRGKRVTLVERWTNHYALPRADTMPPSHISSLHPPSPHYLLGAKGVGEAGCIGLPAAIMNAARDALSHLGEVELQFPLTSEQLWRAMHGH